MIEPEKMCMNHILGEHLEVHALYAHLEKRKRIGGFIISNCIEPKSVKIRHDLLASFLRNHKTPMESNPDTSYLKPEEENAKVDVIKSYALLIERCKKCREKQSKETKNEKSSCNSEA